MGMLGCVDLKIIDLNLIVEFNIIMVLFFGMIYSILDFVGVCFYILKGVVVYMGDFKFD